ncbi:transposase [Parvularcula dongshanensis]|uniref:Transposase n=1 Tax=Parvularcula dongshanensis TaxID=1173995 RepID=A0A840I3V2_9PROT|nr:transposase [Parvularcula dongshanensis]MBB4658943.1 transposase [Parvularcula dongshanensis]
MGAREALDRHPQYRKSGGSGVDDRSVISSILFVPKKGHRWREVPSEYSLAVTVYNRYNRWSRRRIW